LGLKLFNSKREKRIQQNDNFLLLLLLIIDNIIIKFIWRKKNLLPKKIYDTS